MIVNKIVSIHQPNFFPWLGYFDKINRGDIFILLDHVQFQKTGGTWTNRVKIFVNGNPAWVTGVIDRNFSGTKPINEIRFLEGNPWREKFLKNLETNYRRHPFYSETVALLEPLILNRESKISEYNVNAVSKICEAFGWDLKKIRKSSDFNFHSHSNELLCDLTLAVGGGTYMCGGGADGYQESAVFGNRNVNLVRQDFRHPRYQQKNSAIFTPGLSIIDSLMNLGQKGTAELFSLHRCDE